MSRKLLLLGAALCLSVACKKKVEVADLPDGADRAGSPAAVAPAVPPDVFERMERNFQRVHFEFDSAELNTASKEALKANVVIMQEHSDLGLLIQGHCDERGTTDYNLALGDNRAQAVYAYMKTSGIAPSRLRTVSMGEEVPLVAEHGEHAWSQNRRAEFVVVSGEVGLVKGTTSAP
jgi:peptidoglycan-associated lipoprotein